MTSRVKIRPNPDKKKKEPKEQKKLSIYDEYVAMLEEKKQNPTMLVDDGSVLLMKYDDVVLQIEAVKVDVRKSANGTVSAHTRMRKQLRVIRDNVDAIRRLSLAMERAREVEKNKFCTDDLEMDDEG